MELGTVVVLPGWVVPSVGEFEDAFWLSWRVAEDTGAPAAWGVADVLVWVMGQESAPVTRRAEQPVTRESAGLELRAAGVIPLPHMWRLIAAELGVAEWEPRRSPQGWSGSVYATVKWLLGTGGDVEPPVELPVRTASGSVATDVELYVMRVKANPWRYDLPEAQAELRLTVARESARSRRLAELIEDTKQQMVG